MIRRARGLRELLPIVPVVVLALASACSDSAGDPSNPGADGGGSSSGDGGASSSGEGGSSSGDGGPVGPIEPGTPGGPITSDTECPSLEMPTGAPSVFVDANAAGAEDGSKGSPFRTIGKALAAAPAGGVVWVAAGTYKESLTVPAKDLTILGGFAAGFGARTDACASIVEAPSASQTAITADSDVRKLTIEGFTVRKSARAIAVTGDETGATISVSSSVFAENGRPAVEGGAVVLDRVNAKVVRCLFKDNRAAKGAALSSYGSTTDLLLDGSMFARNIGHSDHGGAAYLSPKTGKLTRNTFKGNVIGQDVGYGWGAAVIVYKSGANPVNVGLSYNVFTDNLSSVGAVFVDEGATVTMSHDLLFKNRGYPENGVVRGAAIYVDGNGSPGGGSTLTAEFLTVVDNVYTPGGTRSTQARGGNVYVEGFSKATFTNTIFWNNGNEALYSESGCSVSVSHSIAPSTCAGPGTCTIGAGVFQPAQVDFVDEAGNDFHEKSTAGHYTKGSFVNDAVTSPAIDKADPAASVGSEPAPNGGRANLGAYGQTSQASKSP
ncbi:MAG: DUF1565 domain-containing protein [Deltaproteobacteria bacterium]|nr:DUF1565 domain-containing protein [Deltaproteobacteria bacterium]